MIVKTGRFGDVTVDKNREILIPNGILGFPQYTKYCLVDPGDETLILWLQSLENPDLAFAVLEPKIFRPDYVVRLSGMEMRELKVESLKNCAILCILTIPQNIMEMTANLKAPIVINLKDQVARQVVLQENEYSIRHLMFKELRAHLAQIRMASAQGGSEERKGEKVRTVLSLDHFHSQSI